MHTAAPTARRKVGKDGGVGAAERPALDRAPNAGSHTLLLRLRQVTLLLVLVLVLLLLLLILIGRRRIIPKEIPEPRAAAAPLAAPLHEERRAAGSACILGHF